MAKQFNSSDFAKAEVFTSKTAGISYALLNGTKYYFRDSELGRASEDSAIVAEELDGGGYWLTFSEAPKRVGLFGKK